MVTLQHYGYFPFPLTNLITRVFLHAEEAPCNTDSRYMNQNFPGQICESRPEFGGKTIYAFPVSYASQYMQDSNYRRQWSQVNNLKTYGLEFDQVWSSSLMTVMTPVGDWNAATFPTQQNEQYTAPSDAPQSVSVYS
jgi:hypothetical protein